MAYETSLALRTGRRWALLIAVLTVVVYARVVTYGFVPFDDPRYVQEHPRIWAGLTAENVRWALTTDYFSNWHPLTWLSYMLDCQLAGLHPGWMHGVNLLLHVVNSLLLFSVLRRLTSRVGPSVFVALMFALHPLHVESVAWISERKDVLSTSFWLLCMNSYLSYVRRPTFLSYAWTATLLFIGLSAKAMLVTLPCVLLLLDYWPLERFTAERGRGAWRIAFRLFAEKIPLFCVVALSAVLTWMAQSSSGAMEDIDVISIPVRVGNAAIAYWQYLFKTIWPAHLAAYYPHPGYGPPDYLPTSGFYRLAIAAAAALLLITLGVLRFGRSHRYLAVGWLWFLGTLVPVIGLVQVGMQGMADRYSYVPSIGLFIMIAWGVPDMLSRMPSRRLWLDASATAAVAACFALTWLQVGYWRDGVTLYTHSIAVTENNARAQGLLAVALARAGRTTEAVDVFRAALASDPGSSQLRNHLAGALTNLGRYDEAGQYFRESIAIKPEVVSTHFNYGNCLAGQRKLDEAIAEYRTAIRLDPSSAKAYNNLANLLVEQGRVDEAAEHYKTALQLNPQHRGARHNLQRLTARLPGGEEDPALLIAP